MTIVSFVLSAYQEDIWRHLHSWLLFHFSPMVDPPPLSTPFQEFRHGESPLNVSSLYRQSPQLLSMSRNGMNNCSDLLEKTHLLLLCPLDRRHKRDTVSLLWGGELFFWWGHLCCTQWLYPCVRILQSQLRCPRHWWHMRNLKIKLLRMLTRRGLIFVEKDEKCT